MLKRHFSFTLLFLITAPFLAAAASDSDLTEAGRAMVEAEKNFYRTGQEKGTRAAFLTFLADNAVVFRPGPMNGKLAWEKQKETGLDLIWEPTFATIARSADFGYTTGPAKWKANKKDEKFLGYGHFVSIWKKQKDGSWKVAVDLGIENPEPHGKPEDLRIIVSDTDLNSQTNEERREVLGEAQKELLEEAKKNSTEAILDNAGIDLRVYRDGSFPAVGKDAAKALLKSKTGTLTLEPMDGDVSATADLAYIYGRYTFQQREGQTETGHFFQIWRTNPAGSWKLVLDWQKALPPGKP